MKTKKEPLPVRTNRQRATGETMIKKKISHYSHDSNSNLNQRQIIEQHLRWMFNPGDVFEVCLIGTTRNKHPLWGNAWTNSGPKAIIAGWFDDIDKAVKTILRADKDCGCTGIYCTLNPVNPVLLARANNRLKPGVPRTQDKEITQVRHLLIDADPIRPSGISSTDEEKQAALDLLQTVKADLTDLGWGEPLVGDSGNGGHLIYKIVPDCAGLVPDLLKAISEKYSTQKVDIDTTVGNPARLTKVYGTMTRKGDETEDRSHRYALLISKPDTGEVHA